MRTELRRVAANGVACWSGDSFLGHALPHVLPVDDLFVVLEETHSSTGAWIVWILSPRFGRCWLFASVFHRCTEAAGSRAEQ